MLRTDVIQMFLDLKENSSYLEIGVKDGDNFFPLKASSKTAVDPKFVFTLKSRFRWMYKNHSNLTARYFEITSDQYFEKPEVKIKKMDVVFIDGLHTYQQSLRDVLNSLTILKDNGVIIMHDCNPPHAAAAYPSESPATAALAGLSGWNGEWCGDVWKTICYLRSTRADLRSFVLDTDYGLGIITKGDADEMLNISEESISVMTYDDLVKDREKLIGLRNKEYLFEFMKTL